MPADFDVNVYMNFVLYAVLGKLAEADAMLVEHSARIERVAAYLMARRPLPSAVLYRGMLVERSANVAAEPQYKFVSWSEDRDVACWFASLDAYISGPFAMFYPSARGVVLQLPATQSRRVLFHHSWATGWEQVAAMHPHMGREGARQIAWSLRTQREVITAPLTEIPPVTPIEEVPHPPTHELDARLMPPWISSSQSDAARTQGCVPS